MHQGITFWVKSLECFPGQTGNYGSSEPGPALSSGAHLFLMPYLAERASVTTGILKFFSQRIEMLRKILSKIMMEFKKKKLFTCLKIPSYSGLSTLLQILSSWVLLYQLKSRQCSYPSNSFPKDLFSNYFSTPGNRVVSLSGALKRRLSPQLSWSSSSSGAQDPWAKLQMCLWEASVGLRE